MSPMQQYGIALLVVGIVVVVAGAAMTRRKKT
jgi:hypothetical protein